MMRGAALKFTQRMAEDEICCACDGLSAPEALGALLEIVAQILADEDIVPGTEDYENFMLGIEKSLPPRIAQLRWDGVIPLPTERPGRVADEGLTQSVETPASWDSFVPPPAKRPEPVADEGPTLPTELPASWDSFVPPPAERPDPVVDEGPSFPAEIPTLRDGIAPPSERLELVADEVSTLSAEIPTSEDGVVPPPAERSEPAAEEESILPIVRVTSAAA
jgi:hypothetical protein